MKKILFISKDLNIGGMEKALINLLNSLKDDYDITLILEKKEGILLNELSEVIKVKEYQLSNNKNIFLRKFTNFFNRLKWSLKYKNKFDFSCNYATYSYIGSRLAQIASKNSSIYIHSDYYNVFKKDNKQMISFFEPHKMSKFKNIFFVSNESKNNFLKVYQGYEKKSVVINNFVDHEGIIKKANEKCPIKINKKNINFIFIGRLDNESKNLKLLIESFKNVAKESKKHKLFIVGSGPYKKEIKKFLTKHKLKNITLIDETTNPYCYLNSCDCLILTSNYEGFPVVYIEALVLNKMIMTTIPTSDEALDISDYCIKIERNVDDITKKVLSFAKENDIYNLDFEKMNENKKRKVIEKIEV